MAYQKIHKNYYNQMVKEFFVNTRRKEVIFVYKNIKYSCKYKKGRYSLQIFSNVYKEISFVTYYIYFFIFIFVAMFSGILFFENQNIITQIYKFSIPICIYIIFASYIFLELNVYEKINLIFCNKIEIIFLVVFSVVYKQLIICIPIGFLGIATGRLIYKWYYKYRTKKNDELREKIKNGEIKI